MQGSVRKELEEQDVQQGLQHLLRQVQLRPLRHHPEHTQRMSLLCQLGQLQERQTQVPLDPKPKARTHGSLLDTIISTHILAYVSDEMFCSMKIIKLWLYF
jgi:hypothetical protein